MPWDVIRSTGLRRVAIGIVNQGLPCALPELSMGIAPSRVRGWARAAWSNGP
jgi:hypothetical protein